METKLQKLDRIYTAIYNDKEKLRGEYSWGGDSDRIWSDYPELSPSELIVISGFLERCTLPQSFKSNMIDFGVK